MAAKILLVEPDTEQRDQFLMAIKGAPFEVCHFAKTNAEAVQLYDKLRPHLLVLPLVSETLGAAAALDKLRKLNPAVKAVASYDVRSTHLLMAAYSHGAVAAIKQPFRLHRIVEKLTYAIASERHEKLVGSIVRLEHAIQVRYRGASWLSRSRVGFCERLGPTDMDLNTEVQLKVKAAKKLDLLLPPPTGVLRFAGVVEDVEMTRPDSWRAYVSLKNVSDETQAAIEAFVVKAARRV